MKSSTRTEKFQYYQFASVIFLFWFSMYLYVPTLPIYTQIKTNYLVLTGIILAMYGLWQGLARFPLGIYSDRIGKRKVFIFIGIGLSIVGAWLMGTATNSTALLVGRAITGLAAATWVPMVVAFTGLFPANETLKASAIVNLINSLGMMVGTFLTGWLNDLGGYSLAFYLAMASAGLAGLALLPFNEISMVPQKRSLGEIKTLVVQRSVLVPSLLGALAQYAVWATVFSYIPILAKQYGASSVLQSMLLSMNIAVVLIGNLTVTTLVKRFGTRSLLFFSFFIMCLGMILASLANSLVLVFVAQFCNGFGLGIGFSILMGLSVQSVKEQERSTAMGLFQAVYAIGMFSGPWVSGYLADNIGIQPMFAATSVVVLFAAIYGIRQLHF